MELIQKKWKLYLMKKKFLMMWGLACNKIFPYNDKLIEKFRTIYYGGVPASVILLTNGLSDGFCYDRALLLSRAFLDEKCDVKLIYASIQELRLNPKYVNDPDPLCSEHCIVEITTEGNKQYICDTSCGFIFDKKLYWLIEKPKVRKVNDKESIIEYLSHEPNNEEDQYISVLIFPLLEECYGRKNEMYSAKGIELLQREIELYKKSINYEEIRQEMDNHLKSLGKKK